MKIRMTHVWWIGVVVFTPAILLWGCAIVGLGVQGRLQWRLDWYHIGYVFLPLLAAVIGFGVPLVCLRTLGGTPSRSVKVFIAYALIMLTWGVVDTRCENYQIGGHDYPNSPLVDGHRHYFHGYFTWYFLPYTWIERGIPPEDARD